MADGRLPLLDGAGAARTGDRWSSPGRRVVYASLSYANALLEILAHRSRAQLPPGYVWLTLDVPAGVEVAVIDPARTPGWDAPDEAAARAAGNTWLDAGWYLLHASSSSSRCAATMRIYPIWSPGGKSRTSQITDSGGVAVSCSKAA